MTHNFEEGDLVRNTKTHKQGILAEINPNPDFVADDETWAELMSPVEDYLTIGDVERPEDLELITKKAHIPAKRLPTMEELRNYLSSSLHSGWGPGIQITETGPDGEDAVEVFGQLGNQRFDARVKIEYIRWVD